MMVFQKGVGPTEKVSFIGLDESLLAEATLADLQSNNYSLKFKQYLPQSVLEVDEGFQMVKLGDVCELKTGTYITKSTSTLGEYPVYGGGDAGAKISEFNRENRFVISKDGVSEKCVRYVSGKFFLNHHGWTFDVKPNATYLYVGYWLLNNQPAIYSLAAGTAQKGINMESFLGMDIPLPSLERQQQIVEAIDGWTELAQQEEHALKTLEKLTVFQIREMSSAQPRVRLGDVCEIRSGKTLTKEHLEGGDVPVIGGGVSPMGYHGVHNREAYAVVLAQVGSAGNVSRYPVKSWITNNGMTIHPKAAASASISNDDMLYYVLKPIQDDIKGLAEGTAQPKLSASSVLSLEISLPPIAEQQALQSNFDEIRHKHEKIKMYKAKAQDAIQRLIPGA
jgi:restriction endonuclease S subunit